MKITYKIAEQDFVDGWWLRLKRTPRGIFFQSCNVIALLAWFSVIGCTIYCRFAILADDQWEAILIYRNYFLTLAVVFSIWALLFNVVSPYRVRRYYRKEPIAHAELTTEITSDGFSQTSSAGSNTTIQWSMFKCWKESKTVFICLLTNIQYVVIPKHALSSDQQTDLRTLLAQVLPKK